MVEKNNKKEALLKTKARKYSIKEGIFSSSRASFGDLYISPFAIAVNASNSMVSLLTSILGLLGPLGQISGSKFLEKFSRKQILRKTIFFESLMWLPLILIAFLFYKGIVIEMLPLLILITFAIYTILLNMGHPAWFSWMGEIVEEKHRGKYFSKRNLILGFVSVILAIISAVFLDYFKKQGGIMFGFMILFLLAFITRLIARKILKKQYEPKIKLKKTDHISFWEFISNAPKTNFGKFTIFRSLIGFSAAIASPLIAVYLLRYIGFSYVDYMIITLGGTFVSLFILEFWGKFSDRYGNYRTMVLASIIIPLVPLLWILNTSIIYLLLIPSLASGIGWAGIHLAAGNFIYDNVPPQKRGLMVSYFNMVWGIGVALGAGVGAFLIKFLHSSFIEPLILIFIISAIARIIVAIWWLPKIKEVRETKKFSIDKALKHLIFKGAKLTLIEEAHEIMSIKRYIQTK
ncbi:MAG: MFS transporter [archaeon]